MKYRKSAILRKQLAKHDLASIPTELLREAKVNGFSDEQINRILQHGEEGEDI